MGTVNDNDNGIVSFETPISMNNDIVIDAKLDKSRKVEMIADRLVSTYDNAQYREYYCRVAWKLPELRIWQNVEQSMKGNQPARLFSYLCKKDGV